VAADGSAQHPSNGPSRFEIDLSSSPMPKAASVLHNPAFNYAEASMNKCSHRFFKVEDTLFKKTMLALKME
jgi:hypothetical protein